MGCCANEGCAVSGSQFSCGFQVYGLGFRVLGFRVQGLGFEILDNCNRQRLFALLSKVEVGSDIVGLLSRARASISFSRVIVCSLLARFTSCRVTRLLLLSRSLSLSLSLALSLCLSLAEVKPATSIIKLFCWKCCTTNRRRAKSSNTDDRSEFYVLKRCVQPCTDHGALETRIPVLVRKRASTIN